MYVCTYVCRYCMVYSGKVKLRESISSPRVPASLRSCTHRAAAGTRGLRLIGRQRPFGASPGMLYKREQCRMPWSPWSPLPLPDLDANAFVTGTAPRRPVELETEIPPAQPALSFPRRRSHRPSPASPPPSAGLPLPFPPPHPQTERLPQQRLAPAGPRILIPCAAHTGSPPAMNWPPKHKDSSFPPPMDFPVAPLPPFNPLQEHILRQGLGKNMAMQASSQYKRPSFHPSGAETDTDLPARKKTRSPPRTPTQGSPGQGPIRRGNSFNTPPGQNKGFIPGSELGLLGLAGIAGVRARSAIGEAKKEEVIDDDERHGHGILDGSVGGSSHLSFVSTITEDQWRHMNENELRAAEGDDEESDNGVQQSQQQQETWVGGEGARTIGLGPGFSGGLGRAKNVIHAGAGQVMGAQGGYPNPAGGTMGLNVRQNQQEKRNQQPLSQLDDTLDFTDNYTETDAGDYGEFTNSRYQDNCGQGAYGPSQGAHAQYSEPPPGQLGPNHPPAGTVYRPRSPSPSEVSFPASPTLSNSSPETIEDILALEFSPESHSKRWSFFRQCTHEQWAKYGEVILQRQAELAREMMKSREERREAVRVFEEELKMWEGEVDGNMERARQYMARMKTSFELLKVG
ncbi:hypothetical protein EV426DRAFT_721544 [Tirmania nivea]|nr:hypothetical protein EV426DRAFT_721544 [Tirmania nivea]